MDPKPTPNTNGVNVHWGTNLSTHYGRFAKYEANRNTGSESGNGGGSSSKVNNGGGPREYTYKYFMKIAGQICHLYLRWCNINMVELPSQHHGNHYRQCYVMGWSKTTPDRSILSQWWNVRARTRTLEPYHKRCRYFNLHDLATLYPSLFILEHKKIEKSI